MSFVIKSTMKFKFNMFFNGDFMVLINRAMCSSYVGFIVPKIVIVGETN